MYQPTPATLRPSTVTTVSSAPYSLPLAYVTCCIRVSLLSSGDSVCALFGSPKAARLALVQAGRVELGHPDVGVTPGERPLGERVDLGAVERHWPRPRVLVGGDVEAVRVHPDVRVVAQARAVRVYRRPGVAVVRRVQRVLGPGTQRVLGHRDVEVVGQQQVTAGRVHIQGEYDQEERPGRRVVQAARVGDLRAERTGRPDELRRVPEEGVEVDDARLRRTTGAVDLEHVVECLDHVPAAHA